MHILRYNSGMCYQQKLGLLVRTSNDIHKEMALDTFLSQVGRRLIKEAQCFLTAGCRWPLVC